MVWVPDPFYVERGIFNIGKLVDVPSQKEGDVTPGELMGACTKVPTPNPPSQVAKVDSNPTPPRVTGVFTFVGQPELPGATAAPKPEKPTTEWVGGHEIRRLGKGMKEQDRARGTKYLEGDKRRKYEVVLGQTIRYRYQWLDGGPRLWGGLPVDNTEIREEFKRRYATRTPDPLPGQKPARKIVPAIPGLLGDKAMIWVCVVNDNVRTFYTHVCKVNRFHHSSFVAGGDVDGAGEWLIEEGVLKAITAISGHYLPTLSHFHKAVRMMEPAFHKGITKVVMHWAESPLKVGEWRTRPVEEFLDDPSGDKLEGIWKVHPHAE
jgi:hypothetical protein